MEILKNSPELSIILPMYNEEDNISKNLKFVIESLKDLSVSWEMIVVNDGSKDNSLKECEEALKGIENVRVLSYNINRGRGYALRKGFEAAKGKYIVTTESDLSWGADIIFRIYKALILNNADSVIVSPYLEKNGLVNVPLKRRILSRFGNKILTFGLPGNLTMVTGMTRGYKKSVIDKIILQMDRKEIHLEIVSKLIGIGAEIVEIPGSITWEKRDKNTRDKKKKFKAKKIILSHLYFSVVEAPIYFIGTLGLILLSLGLLGVGAIIVLKIIGFGLRRIPFFPLYVFFSIIMGTVIFIFSILSSQITKLQRELIKVYAKIKEDNERERQEK